MKKLTLLLVMAFSVVLVYGQDENRSEVQTLFSNQKSLGFYGSFSLGYSQINGKDALVSGGRAAMIFNHSTAIGIAGYGFVNNVEGYHWQNDNILK